MFKRFIKDESGMETIEFVVVLAVVAGLIAIVAAVAENVSNTGEKAQNEVTSGLANINTFLDK